VPDTAALAELSQHYLEAQLAFDDLEKALMAVPAQEQS